MKKLTEVAVDMYREGYSLNQIREYFGCANHGSVKNYLVRRGVKMRGNSGANRKSETATEASKRLGRAA